MPRVVLPMSLTILTFLGTGCDSRSTTKQTCSLCNGSGRLHSGKACSVCSGRGYREIPTRDANRRDLAEENLQGANAEKRR